MEYISCVRLENNVEKTIIMCVEKDPKEKLG
jgi:tRNA splicing endonuclease